jgi:hypothetical protein
MSIPAAKLLIGVVIGAVLAYVGLVCLTDYGRTVEQESAQCQMEATRVYPDGGFGASPTVKDRFSKEDPRVAEKLVALTTDEFREYVRLCMTAKGFKRADDPKSCPRAGVENAACFKERSLVEKLLGS